MEALILADVAVADDVLSGLEDALLTAGVSIVAHLGDHGIVVDADLAVPPNFGGPPFTLLTEPPAAVPPGLDDLEELYVAAWSLTAMGPLAETDGVRTDEGASFAPLGGCVA